MRGGSTAFRAGRSGVLFVCVLLLAAVIGGAPAGARTASSIVIDAATGKVLYQSNADARTYPASLTKMMTLYLLFEALEKGRIEPDQRLNVSRRAAGQPATNLALRAGDPLTVQQAIRALIIRSANDVAVVVAEALSGTEAKFAQLMTARARALGMKNTTFQNASGLPNTAQRSTARDLAILARALIRDFPQYYPQFAAKSFSYRGRTYSTHNRLLGRYAGADGLKTGYINASGYNLATSAVRNGRRVIAIVLGGASISGRDAQMVKLLDRGFDSVGKLPQTQVAENVGGTPKIAVIPSTKPVLMAAAEAPDLPIPPAAPATEVAAAPAIPVPAVAVPSSAVPPSPAPTLVAAAPPTVGELQVAAVAASAPPARTTLPAQIVVDARQIAALGTAPEPETVTAPSVLPAVANLLVVPTKPEIAADRLAALDATPSEVPAGATALAIPTKPSRAPPTKPDNERNAITTAGFRPPEKPLLEEADTIPVGVTAAASGVIGQLNLGPWGVQVGAFSKYDPAHQAATKASEKSPTLRSAVINIEEVMRDSGRIFRARIIGLSEQEAQSACRELKAKKIPCVIVRPEMTLAMTTSQ